jgi:hypothetical protein
MAQAPSPHMCRRHLLVWEMSVTSFSLSALAASTCVAAVQHHLLLALVSCCVLCSKRPTRRRILHSLGWGPRQALEVPLPLAVAPQGMPRQPCLHVLITGDIQLIAEPHVWLRYIVPGGGWRRACVVSSFLTGPLTTGWATCCTSCWGAVPLGLARRGGLPSVPCPFVWATASDDIHADCSWAVVAVRSPT